MKTNKEVEKIINYLEAKIKGIQDRLSQYQGPLMQEMAKNSPHLQMEYTRLSIELQANQENLLVIKNFSFDKDHPNEQNVTGGEQEKQ